MNRSTPILILGFILLAALPPRAMARTPAEERVIRRHEWKGALAPGATVDVTNLHGDIRARCIDGSEVILLGMIQKLKSDPDEPVIAVNDDRTLTISVTYPERKEDGASPPPRAAPIRGVDLTVLIPAGARLRARTDKGLIQAKGMRGDVIARSSRGDIVITTRGCANAYTERGAISLHLKNPVWRGAPTLETLTGDIQVRLPENVGVEVIAETSGEIATEYSIQIDREPTSHRKRARALISGGGQMLYIKSARGNVKLLGPFPRLKKSRGENG